jgi:nucleotide-binding universal stress UspA family protein
MSAILVGFDGTERSDDALALAAELAALSGARLLLGASVRTPEVALLGDEAARALVQEAVEEMEALLEERAAALRERGTEVVCVARAYESAPFLLQRIAEHDQVDLVVVGSTHTSGWGRVLPGSTSERLLYGAPCPVAVAPAGLRSAERWLRTVGVAFDGSDEASAALRAGTALAERSGARLEVLTVLDVMDFGAPALMGGPGYDRTRGDLEAAARDHLDAVVAGLPTAVHATGRCLAGDPAGRLAEASEELDLLLAGSRGYGPLRAVLLGGVTGRLVRQALCPIVITPRGVADPLIALFGPGAGAAARAGG